MFTQEISDKSLEIPVGLVAARASNYSSDDGSLLEMNLIRAIVVLLWLPFIVHRASGYGIDLMVVEDDSYLAVECIYNLLKKYFTSGFSLSGSMMVMSASSAPPYLQNRLLQAFHMDPDNIWSIIVRYPEEAVMATSMQVLEKPQMYFIIVMDLEEEDMEDYFEDWKSKLNWNPLAQFVVYVESKEETDENMTELMIEVLMLFLNKKIFNVNVIGQSDVNGQLFSKTAFPYEPDNQCGTMVVALQTLDTCDYFDDEEGIIFMEEQNRGLLMDKIPTDLSGCPLVAYSRSREPYMFERNGQLHGIEWTLVSSIAEILNINVTVLICNNTVFQMLQGLLDGEVDIVLGGIDEDPRLSSVLTATVPYYQDELTWCVMKARETLHLFKFLQVFQVGIYGSYFGITFLNGIVIYTIQRRLHLRERLHGLHLLLLGFIFHQSGRITIRNSVVRFCLLQSLLCSVIMASTFNSLLVNTLTSPSTLPQIKSMSQILENKMSVSGSVEVIRHLNKDGEIFKYIRQNFIVCYDIDDCMLRAADDPTLAIAVSQEHSIHNPRIPKGSLYCFDRDENIYTYLVTMLMPTKMPLFHLINPIIQYAIETGHLTKWARDLELERVVGTSRNVEETGYQSLKLRDVTGILLFNATALAFDVFVFLTEHAVHYMYTKGTRLKIVKWLHLQFGRK